MKKKCIVIGLLVLSLCACSTPPTKTEQGVAIGAGGGAALGALIGQAMGHNTSSTLIGAGVGAVVGGAAGGMIGNYMEKQEAEMRQSLANVEAASVQREQQVLEVTFKSDLFFDVNSSVLKAGSFDEIQRVATVLNRYPQTNVLVEGHTDSTGSEQYNMGLSQQRAEAVRTALVSYGVAPQRVRTIGYGASKPVAGNNDPSGRQLNRRVRILITPAQA